MSCGRLRKSKPTLCVLISLSHADYLDRLGVALRPLDPGLLTLAHIQIDDSGDVNVEDGEVFFADGTKVKADLVIGTLTK